MTGPLLVLIGLLAGSIPFGYLAGRLLQGIDLRNVGSGGTGATNVLRTLGKKASAAVLILDFLKGLLPVLVARWMDAGDWWIAAVAIATVVGHCWSPFIAFRGGKGVATGGGAAIALFPPVLLVVPVVLLIIWQSRYVSLGSLIGAGLAVVLAAVAAASGQLAWASVAAIAAIAAIIVFRHRDNIDRLRSGSERRLGQKVQLSS
ncbi:MAG: glycerol-3-phosphate 1-O-acyltransferase PlsY [Thermomicrobiales bacterium]